MKKKKKNIQKKHKYKITFLMAAHNEEKLIPIALERLVQVHKDYPNMEVLIGLDGCTDKTPDIVRKFAKKNKFIKFFEMNEREGKQAVLDKLQPYIKGDIVIIHDADWVFVYESKKELLEYLSLFDNPKVGGIADSIDSEMTKPNFWQINSYGFLASAWGNHFLIEYIKKKFTNKINDNLSVYDKNRIKFCPFVDVYRKSAMDKTEHKKELRAGDHVERALRLFNAGYDLVTFNNKQWPHFNETYNEQSVKDMIKQRIRGVLAKRKIKTTYQFKIPFFGFYVPFLFYIIKNSFKVPRAKDFLAIYIYLFSMFYGIIASKFMEKISVKDVWRLRNVR